MNVEIFLLYIKLKEYFFLIIKGNNYLLKNIIFIMDNK